MTASECIIKTDVPCASIHSGAILAADKTQLETFGKQLQILWVISDAIKKIQII